MSIENNQLQLKHGTSNYGRFYPTGYVVAFFGSTSDRQRVEGMLTERSWPAEDLIQLSGHQLAELRQDIRDHRSLWGAFVSKFADQDAVLDNAAEGEYEALLIYAPHQDQRDSVREALDGLAVLAQSYQAMSFSQIPVPMVETVAP